MIHEQIRLHRAWPEQIPWEMAPSTEHPDTRMASPEDWAEVEQEGRLGLEQAATAANSPWATQLDLKPLVMDLHEQMLKQMALHEQRLKQMEMTPPDQLELQLGATRGGQEGAAWVHEQVQRST